MGKRGTTGKQEKFLPEGAVESLDPLPPDRILQLANLTTAEDRASVVAWTKVNPYSDVFCFVCSGSLQLPMLLPCFWPHLIIMSPCICASICSDKNRIESEHWILTKYDLKVVNTDYDICCIPKLWTSGDLSKNIPLNQITDAGLDSRGSGLCNCCVSDLGVIYVDTASSAAADQTSKRSLFKPPGSHHEAYGVALQRSKHFLGLILRQQRMVREGTVAVASAVTSQAMQRDGNMDIDLLRERLVKLQKLMDDGLINPDEFESKRKKLVAAL